MIQEAIKRITTALRPEGSSDLNPDSYAASIRKSFIMSVDQCHAIHPNYASKHEANHAPLMNKGVVMKINSNQRYTTNGITGFIVREVVRKAGITPVQEFVVRNDCPCGTTIGPVLAASTGIRTVDAGMPQLSMHSCREVMGIVDCKFIFAFFVCRFPFYGELFKVAPDLFVSWPNTSRYLFNIDSIHLTLYDSDQWI